MPVENPLTQIGTRLLAFLPQLAAAVAIVLVGWILSRVARRLCRTAMRHVEQNSGAVTFIGSAVSVIVKVVAVVIALSALGVDTSVIVGGLSALGLGVSLALKSNMANVACGIQMLFTKPFQVGDSIFVMGIEGKVMRIELMSTILHTADNKEVIIPNAKLYDGVIINSSALGTRRVDLAFAVPAAKAEEAKALLEKLACSDSRVLRQPAPQVAVEQSGADLLLTLRLWCGTADCGALSDSLREAGLRALQEAACAPTA